ncbi:hypothetical protein EYR41_007472 [Orbilia oligospora]|uniref:Uncharacterized protein n=1 Tax=Orbilia oligospora TaxID=2813651 RepID=A0A7C8P7F3_ORBOL|nr:hypothetical protein TWF751_002083 [Orbilia oligospora]TGJ68419.1 hypothetical protein EYR41_007472 [Orbilia oligospora]
MAMAALWYSIANVDYRATSTMKAVSNSPRIKNFTSFTPIESFKIVKEDTPEAWTSIEP